jgi:hypothetical protein
VSFDVAYGWEIGDEWMNGAYWQSCIKVEKFCVDGVVTEPFLLPIADQILSGAPVKSS